MIRSPLIGRPLQIISPMNHDLGLEDIIHNHKVNLGTCAFRLVFSSFGETMQSKKSGDQSLRIFIDMAVVHGQDLSKGIKL